jgi:hypothetical protein
MSATFGLVPVGGVIAWAKSFTNTPTLSTQGRTEYVECNGQTLSDSQSVFNGQVIPNLNNSGGSAANRFLRGNTTSGGTGGSDSQGWSLSGATFDDSTGTQDAITHINGESSFITIPTVPSYYEVVYLMRVK